MPAVANWAAPTQFDLTNPFNGSLSFNVQTVNGLYLLDQSGCSLDFEVRSTKSNVPQADGSILHHRFLTGAVMPLTIQLWEEENKPACGELLQSMLDDLSGALRSLLNAGDNEGRLAWEVDGGNERMLDDVRLLVYPSYQMGNLGVVTVTLDSEFPYAQDLTQIRTPCENGDVVTITNTGTADYDPVFLVNELNGVVSTDPVPSFLIENLTTGLQFEYLGSGLPGGVPISSGGHYAEINTFKNTIYLDGDGADLKAGVDELNSEYFSLRIGANDISISGCDMDVLWAPAYG